MYTKTEIIEMLLNQYDELPEPVKKRVIAANLKRDDSDIADDFKLSCGARLEKVGSNFIIKYN